VTGRRDRKFKELQDDLLKREDNVNLKRKHQITHCGELASEENMDLSQGRMHDEIRIVIFFIISIAY
jgi:hypothetical protein